MRRRTLQRWLIWLLPLVALRAFMPVGFMLSNDADGWRLVLCSGVAAQEAPHAQHPDHAHHAGHDASHDESGSGDPHDAPCPFALAVSSAPGAVEHVAAAGVAPSDEHVHPYAAPAAGIDSTRAHRIRGPPHLS